MFHRRGDVTGFRISISVAGCKALRTGSFPAGTGDVATSITGASVAGCLNNWTSPGADAYENFLFRIEPRHDTPDAVPGDWKALGHENAGFDEVLERLSVVTSALMALSHLEALVLKRPRATAEEISRCSDWADRTWLRPFTGRGARLRVIEP